MKREIVYGDGFGSISSVMSGIRERLSGGVDWLTFHIKAARVNSIVIEKGGRPDRYEEDLFDKLEMAEDSKTFLDD